MLANLKALRSKKGISQQRLAEAIGVSQQSINKYENHNVEPDIQTLMAMARYFHTSVDYLIGFTQIDHVIEQVHPFELNAEEARLLNLWRRLSTDEKQSIFHITHNYLKDTK